MGTDSLGAQVEYQPWKDAEDWVNFQTIDNDGATYWWENEPHYDHIYGRWIGTGRRRIVLQVDNWRSKFSPTSVCKRERAITAEPTYTPPPAYGSW